MTVCTRGWRALVEGAALGLEMAPSTETYQLGQRPKGSKLI